MSEARAQGPLDEVRELTALAARADIVVSEYLQRDPGGYPGVVSHAYGLTQTHPFMGREVSIDGVALSYVVGESADGSDDMPYVLPIDRQPSTTYGVYHGIGLREVNDIETDESQYRLVHMLYAGSDEPEVRPDGNATQTHFYNYVCLPGSEVIPVLPIDAHSLVDLADDPVVMALDHIVYDETISEFEKIHRIGQEVNRLLRKQEFEEALPLNHQRASYLNALGLHDNLQLSVRDVIVAAEIDDTSEDYMVIKLESDAHMIPAMFEIATGYEQLTDQEEPLAGGPPELYARIDLPDGRPMMAALKNVLDARRTDEIL